MTPTHPRGRDRRGRGRRGPLAWPPVPAMATRAEAFDELVLDTFGRFRAVLGRRWSDLEIAVEEVPPSDPLPWEDGVPLARLFPRQDDLPARIVLYRRPVEAYAPHGEDLPEALFGVVREQVALVLGVSPDDLDEAMG